MTNHSVLLPEMSSCSLLSMQCATNNIKLGQYWCLLKGLSQKGPNVTMTEIIKPDSNDQSWWTRSLTVVRNIILSYIEDDKEENETLWPQPFGWVLCLWDDHLLLYVCLAMLQEHLHQLMALLVIVQSHQLLLHLPQLLTAKVGGSDPFKEGAESGNILSVL